MKDYEVLEKTLIKVSIINGTYEDKVKPILHQISIKSNITKNQKVSNFSKNEGELNFLKVRKISVNSHKRNRKISVNSSRNSRKISTNSYIEEKLSTGNYFEKIKILLKALFGPYVKIFSEIQELNKLIVLIIPYITVTFVYYGQLMFLERLPCSIKFNSFIIFLSELFSPNLAGWLLKNNSRRKILIFFHGLSVIVCLIFPHVVNPNIISLLLFCNCFSITVNFTVSYVYKLRFLIVVSKALQMAF